MTQSLQMQLGFNKNNIGLYKVDIVKNTPNKLKHRGRKGKQEGTRHVQGRQYKIQIFNLPF